MKEDEIKILNKIDVKLGALIALQMIEEKPETTRDKIKLLSDLGLDYNQVAAILNVPAKYVSKEKSLLKKKNG
jgi:hypothetical protein